ncbi:FAD-binding oxidoreductase [Streptomyces sp. NPDC050264]|uniref:NAD(P)/FAD-dependent oxidoreductase n=1 Tax=Streptomyces sp. NPDC050264 TaxID=3155038 RepID=UPI003422BA66
MESAVVVGAGVLGACVSYHLARAGVRVVVVEEEARPAAGTSGATFSADVTHLKTPYAYYRLNRQGSDEHRFLSEALGGPAWRHPAPLLQWADGDAAQQALRERALRAQGWGQDCRLAPPSVLRELAPAVDPAACGADEVVVHGSACWFDAPRFVHTLLDAAVRHGAETRLGVAVTGLTRVAGRITGVVAGDRSFSADAVVNCAGPGADRVAGFAGVRLPMRRVPGLVTESDALAGAPLTAIVAAPDIDLRPTPGGGVLALSWDVDARLDGAVQPRVDGLPRELHRRAGTVLPGLARARIEDARIGVRPVPHDGLPLVGEVPGAPGLYHLVSHSAVTLAPVLGRLAAQEITTGRPATELTAYRPDRAVPGDVHDENLRAMNRRRPQPQREP